MMKEIPLLLTLVVMTAVALPILADADCGKHHGKHAEHGEHAHAVCPMSEKTVAEKSDVTLTGSILCLHCDLHQSESCHKVFQAKDEPDTLFEICPGSDIDLEEMAHSEVTVTGTMMTSDDGVRMIRIASAEKPAA